MCEKCQMAKERMIGLLNQGDGLEVGKPGFMIRIGSTVGSPCGGVEVFSFFTKHEDMLETLELLPYLYGEGQVDCDTLVEVRNQIKVTADRYKRCEINTSEAMAATNKSLLPTYAIVILMGSLEDFCSSEEDVFSNFRHKAREFLDELEDGLENDHQPFTKREREKFNQWLESGNGLIGESFDLAAYMDIEDLTG